MTAESVGPRPDESAPEAPLRRRSIVVRSLGAALLVLGITGALAFTSAAPTGTPEASAFIGRPTVGALFTSSGDRHYCTASVVTSPAGNLIMTAAHCISGAASGVVFEPGYHDGVAPYGMWRVTGAYAAPGWITAQRPQLDVAFLTVDRARWHGRLRTLQSVTGSNQLATNLRTGEKVTVTAYDDDDGTGPDRPVTCTTRVVWSGSYPEFDCDQYLDGSSGSPWLLRVKGGALVVVGLIGGYHHGGCESWVSYSAHFGPATLRLYATAVAGGTPDVLPSPDGDGCASGL